ncbi:MAG TPA: hypothetical protein V6C76_02880 [Drouetiella sp.]
MGKNTLDTTDAHPKDHNETDASSGEGLGGRLLSDPANAQTLRETRQSSGNDAAKRSPEDQALDDYKRAQDKFKQQLNDYWAGVDISKVQDKPVREFPPVYDGPKNPDPHKTPAEPRTLSTVNDMLAQSKNLNRMATGDKTQPDFKVREASEAEFKQSYAREAINVGKSLNIAPQDMKNVVMGIYAFEGAGKATYDTLSGVPLSLTKDEPGNQEKRRNIHPISTAIGYNQIIMYTNLTFVDRESKEVAARLREVGKDSQRPKEFEAKAKLYEEMHDVLHNELMQMANKDAASKAKYLVDGQPKELLYQDFAKSKDPTALVAKDGHHVTKQELSRALQALNLDGDIGPIVQSRQLRRLVEHFSSAPMQAALKQKADALKSEADAYDKLNPSDKDKALNEVFARAGLDKGQANSALKTKISDYANGKNPNNALDEKDWNTVDARLMSMRRADDSHGPLSPLAVKLLDKLEYSHYGNPTAKDFTAAAAELGNLAGKVEPKPAAPGQKPGPDVWQADSMLDPRKADLPTVNFFTRPGYESNPLVQRKTADELFHTIFRQMHGPQSKDNNWGNAQFEKSFKTLIHG